jgi:hypothetical protein
VLTVLHRVLIALVLEVLKGVLLVETQEIIRLLGHLISSTPLGAASSVTQSSTLTSSVVASQSSVEGSNSSSALGTCPWILDFECKG